MFGNLRGSILSWRKYSKYRVISIGLLAATVVVSISLYLVDYEDKKEDVCSIKRNNYGEGTFREKLEVTVEGKEQKDTIEIEISERQYTEEELQTVFENVVPKLEDAMLGDNKSMDEIRKKLNLINTIPGEPVRIEWEIDRYDVINASGEINQENVTEEGTLVEVKAYLYYSEDETKQMLHVMNVRVCPKEAHERFYKTITDAVNQADKDTIMSEYLEMPAEIEGQKVTYHRPMNNRYMVFLGFGATISFLVWGIEQQNKKEKEVQKEEQMMRDYPEIIGKLNLLLGTGITVKSAWKKILDDYEKQKSVQGLRFAYEEMANTYREMQSGVLEAECYEHFGRNCRLKSYRKLGALLSQNLRKGTKGLIELLNLEAIQAYEERKMRAKRLGEEAGTKLLMPMFLMLAVVLIIVIVPAFMAIQI